MIVDGERLSFRGVVVHLVMQPLLAMRHLPDRIQMIESYMEHSHQPHLEHCQQKWHSHWAQVI